MTPEKAIVTILGALFALVCLFVGICFFLLKLIPSLISPTPDDTE